MAFERLSHMLSRGFRKKPLERPNGEAKKTTANVRQSCGLICYKQVRGLGVTTIIATLNSEKWKLPATSILRKKVSKIGKAEVEFALDKNLAGVHGPAQVPVYKTNAATGRSLGRRINWRFPHPLLSY